jgi:predicted helicase
LGETGAEVSLFTDELPQNSKRVMEQKKLPVRVIIGNPPYSIGQKSEDDNAKNQSYPKLDSRIAETYVKHSNAVLNRGLYDSYIKAFRWASDRIDDKNGGIVAFITNSGWIDTNGMDGFRKCLEKEFNSIYVFNLRGRIRGNIGDRAKREGQNVFDIMTGVAITILVKNPKVKTDKATIYYHDIGDYLKRSDKLEILKTFKNINNSKIEWKVLKPNDHGDWLNQRSDLFSSFIAMGDKDNTKQVVFNIYSGGLLTSRNAWCYNFSKNLLKQNMKNTIDFYNEQRKIYHKIAETDREAVVEKVLEIDQTKISWSRALKNNIKRNLEINYQDEAITVLSFRPFMKEYAYFDRNMNEMVYQQPKLFPTREHKNVFIMISGGGGVKPFFAFICNTIKDYDTDGGVQCFPLYYYEKNDSGTGTLFDQGKETYTRRDAITDFILEQCRERYGHKVTKEDIFYYVYGLLHSNDYRTQFAADLKKVLPRIPLVDIPNDFWAFSKAGRELAELHLNYENIPAYPDVKVEGEDSGNFKVVKMAFAKNKGEVDKTTIIYNSSIKITNIPLEVYDFIVDGKSGLEWIMDRYQVKTDKDSGIKNDPNDWGTEHNNPRYILDLILSVITVSMATNEIVKNLPKLDLK